MSCDSPDPRQAPNPHFLEKRDSGSKNPPFPSSWKREFSVKKSPFFCKGTQRKWGFFDRKLPSAARVRAEGNGGFWTPKPSFPENGDSGPVWGQGNRNLCPNQVLLSIRKRGGVQKSMGDNVPWKIGMLIYLPVTLRPLIS